MTGVSIIVILVTLPLSLCLCIKVINTVIIIVMLVNVINIINFINVIKVINVIITIMMVGRWFKSTSEPSYSDLVDSEKGELRSEKHQHHPKYSLVPNNTKVSKQERTEKKQKKYTKNWPTKKRGS